MADRLTLEERDALADSRAARLAARRRLKHLKGLRITLSDGMELTFGVTLSGTIDSRVPTGELPQSEQDIARKRTRLAKRHADFVAETDEVRDLDDIVIGHPIPEEVNLPADLGNLRFALVTAYELIYDDE